MSDDNTKQVDNNSILNKALCYQEENEQVPVPQVGLTLIQAIEKLENDRKELHDLCGFMLATLEVNIERGGITTTDIIYLNELMTSWRTRFDKIDNTNLTLS